ncbi:MAG: tyrosine-type recombinase/integrase [Armatimonadota bacterium]
MTAQQKLGGRKALFRRAAQIQGSDKEAKRVMAAWLGLYGLDRRKAVGGAVAPFLAWRRSVRGLSQRAVELDLFLLERLAIIAASLGLEPEAMTQDLAREIVARFEEIRQKPRTVNMFLSTAKAFSKWAVSEGLWQSDFFAEFQRRRETQPAEPQHLSDDEAKRLLAAIDVRRSGGLRDWLLSYIGLFAGLRISEMTALRASDIDRARCCLVVRHSKTGRARIAWLPHAEDSAGKRQLERAFEARLDLWEAVRAQLGLGPEDLLFVTISTNPGHAAQGSRVDRQSFRQELKRYARRAGIPTRKVSPHKLRHTCGRMLAANGFSLDEVMQQLGHRSPAMSLHYMKAGADDVQKRMARAQITRGIVDAGAERKTLVTPGEILRRAGISLEDLAREKRRRRRKG